jgi:hypothetical protein
MAGTDIPDCLGLTDETVSRTFSPLAQRGLMRLLNRQEVRLLNPGALEQVAVNTLQWCVSALIGRPPEFTLQ